MAAGLVRLEALALRFPTGVDALRDATLELAAGEVVALVGPSGCGKSSLLRVVAGLVPPTAGRVEVGGRPPAEARRQAHAVGMVFQAPTLLPWRRVWANVALPLELGHVPAPEARRQAMAMLERVGLAGFADAYPIELSGGMQMRAAVARGLVTRPRLLLMDEPFAAADEITRERLDEELLGLHAAGRPTVLFVTHSASEAVFIADRVLVMSARPGRIVEEIAVGLPRPRGASLRGDPAFARIVGEVGQGLRAVAV